jgi:hypothetical protein
MRNRFDQLCKQIAQETLRLSGLTAVHDEILPEPQYADIRHEPDPACAAARARLGLLGGIASSLCLIEIYSGAPDGAALRACLGKHLAFWQQLARKSRSRMRPRRAFAEPSLWIVAAGKPKGLISKLALVPAAGWPRGVYLFGADVLRVGIVVASELPREPSTLLVRLMAAGPLLPRAIEELNALPQDALERAVAEEILVRWNNALERKPSHRRGTGGHHVHASHLFGSARWPDRKAWKKAGRKAHSRRSRATS